MNKIQISLITLELPKILTSITPELKALLKKCLDELAEKAKQTASPLDDMLVQFLRGILNV